VADEEEHGLLALAVGHAMRGVDPARGGADDSDRGSPYAGEDYRRALKRRGLAASMSRTGDCWDR
jgi:putative transposase